MFASMSERPEDRRLQERLDKMYEDKLDGTITTEFWTQKTRETRKRQDHIREELARLQDANKDYMTTGLTILDIARTLPERFTSLNPLERQELLKLLVKNATWGENGLQVTLKEPWNSLQNTLKPATKGLTAFSQEWPARPDSNRRPSA